MIKERLITIWEKSGLSAKELEQKTAIDRSNWYSLKQGRRRANEEDITAMAKVFPSWRWWLLTGETMPEVGQTSPDYDEANRKLDKPTQA